MGHMPIVLESASLAQDGHNVLDSQAESEVTFLLYFLYFNPPIELN